MSVPRDHRPKLFRAVLTLALLAIQLGLPATADEPSASVAPQQPSGEDGIIGSDDRKLLSDFTIDGADDQAVVRAGLAATQRLSCGSTGGSASLVHRSDVIIFAAHEIIEDSGTPIRELDHCVFVVTRKVDGTDREERYPLLLSTLDHGAFASSRKNFHHGNQEDWAIVRLARPVSGIEPYRLTEPSDTAEAGTAVTTVSIITTNWIGPGREPAMLAQNCHSIPAESSLATTFPDVMHFDCDVGYGSSGGAMVEAAASGHPRYIATMIAYSGSHCTAAGLQTCYSIGRRLDADLAVRIKGTSALHIEPEDSALVAAQDARLTSSRDKVAALILTALKTDFPTQRDPEGQLVSDLFGRIKVLIADGNDAKTDSLFFEAYRTLHDPNHTRPEWPWLLLANGESLQRRGRTTDAFFCFQAAYGAADEAMKPYLLIKMARSANDAQVKRDNLRKAYLLGGDALLHVAGADADLPDIKADGVVTYDK